MDASNSQFSMPHINAVISGMQARSLSQERIRPAQSMLVDDRDVPNRLLSTRLIGGCGHRTSSRSTG